MPTKQRHGKYLYDGQVRGACTTAKQNQQESVSRWQVCLGLRWPHRPSAGGHKATRGSRTSQNHANPGPVTTAVLHLPQLLPRASSPALTPDTLMSPSSPGQQFAYRVDEKQLVILKVLCCWPSPLLVGLLPDELLNLQKEDETCSFCDNGTCVTMAARTTSTPAVYIPYDICCLLYPPPYCTSRTVNATD